MNIIFISDNDMAQICGGNFTQTGETISDFLAYHRSQGELPNKEFMQSIGAENFGGLVVDFINNYLVP